MKNMIIKLCGIAALMGSLSACDGIFPVVCARPGIASVEARIRDNLGRPAAIGAVVTIRKPGYELSDEGFGDSLRVWVEDGRNEAGRFEIFVRKPWHQEVHLARVDVPGNACGVKAP